MSNRRRLRPVDPWSDPAGLIAQRFAGVADLHNEEYLEQAKRYTHDDLIRETGIQRISGVRWQLMHVRDLTELELIRSYLYADSVETYGDPGAKEGYLNYLREAMPTGGLVVASCVVAQTHHGALLS